MQNQPLTPAMRRQLQVLAAGRGRVNLATIEALMRRGLVVDNRSTREDLKIHNRMPTSYPLTEAGKAAVKDTGAE